MGNETARVAEDHRSRSRATLLAGLESPGQAPQPLQSDAAAHQLASTALAPEPLRRDAIQRLQRTHGNQAVMRLIVDRKNPAVAPGGVIAVHGPEGAVQRVAWGAGQTTTRGSLSAELQAGLTAAVASSDAAPNPLPGWIRERTKRSLDYNTNLATRLAGVPAVVDAAWDKLKPQAKAANNEVTWKQNRTVVERQKVQTSLDTQLNQTTANRQAEFKWHEPYNNTDGSLPGVAGAGGYREYYAEPDPASTPAAGFWGENRMLLKVSGRDYRDNWWVTTDHYQNFLLVTDAG